MSIKKKDLKELLGTALRVELPVKKGGAHTTAYIFESRRLSLKEAEEIEKEISEIWKENFPGLRMRLATQEELEEIVQKTNEGRHGCLVGRYEMFGNCRVFLVRGEFDKEVCLFIKPDEMNGFLVEQREQIFYETLKATAVFVLTDDEQKPVFPACDLYADKV